MALACRRFEDAEALYAAVARAVVARARDAVRRRGRFDLALAGGATPLPLYRRLAESPLRERVDWTRVHLWFGDERCVPPHHPRSNYRQVREALLDRLPRPSARVHRIRGEYAAPAAAADYARRLTAELGPAPRLDLVLLGVGEDGHTASLFPDRPSLDERASPALADAPPTVPEPRVSLSLLTINAARAVWVLAVGATKAEIVARVFAGDATLPAARLVPVNGELIWWLDAAAASRLP